MKKITTLSTFSGIGGLDDGAKAYCNIIAAVDNDETTLHWHKRNHPQVPTLKYDLTKVDPRKLPAHKLLLTSPLCKGFSSGRGKELTSEAAEADRRVVFSVIKIARVHRPKIIVMENVQQMRNWSLYSKWIRDLQDLGYCVTGQVLNSADFGVPQARHRLFVVASQSGLIHLGHPGLPHVPASSVLKYDAGCWESVERHKPGWLRFYVKYYSNTANPHAINKPLATVLTVPKYLLVKRQNGEWVSRFILPSEMLAAQGFKPTYKYPKGLYKRRASELLGDAVPPRWQKGSWRKFWARPKARFIIHKSNWRWSYD